MTEGDAAGREGRAAAFVKRSEELEQQHLDRFRSGGALAGTLSLRLLRSVAAGWLRAPARPTPARVARPVEGATALTFVGHATIMLTASRARVLVDPLFADTVAGVRRARGACLAVGDALDVDRVLVTCADGDRFCAGSLRKLPQSAALLVPAGLARRARALGFERVIAVAPGDVHEEPGVRVDVVATSRADAVGYVVRAGTRAVYCAGPTGYTESFAVVGARLRPDVAVLSIGGYRPLVLRRERMSPLDAIYAAEDLRVRDLVPVAHGAFRFGHEPEEEPLDWLREIARERPGAPALRILAPGETWIADG